MVEASLLREDVTPSGRVRLTVRPVVNENQNQLTHFVHIDLETLAHLSVALLLSGVLGWERESLGKPAGLRTHILVGVGAALAVGVGNGLIEDLATDEASLMRVDPLRVMEAVLTGIGFLGAGTIIARQRGEHVSGLTTAASIWTTAVIGLAAGVGRYALAASATAIIFVVLRGLGYLEFRKEIREGKSTGFPPE